MIANKFFIKIFSHALEYNFQTQLVKYTWIEGIRLENGAVRWYREQNVYEEAWLTGRNKKGTYPLAYLVNTRRPMLYRRTAPEHRFIGRITANQLRFHLVRQTWWHVRKWNRLSILLSTRLTSLDSVPIVIGAVITPKRIRRTLSANWLKYLVLYHVRRGA